MHHLARRSVALAFVVLVGASLTACAASPTEMAPTGGTAEASHPLSTASPDPTTVGGMTSCTKADLAEAAAGAAQALGEDNIYTLDDLLCADGWAVTVGVLASTDNPGTGAPTSFVFEQQGKFWILQDKTKVCGTQPTATVAPADAAIPAKLFIPGCAAG